MCVYKYMNVYMGGGGLRDAVALLHLTGPPVERHRPLYEREFKLPWREACSRTHDNDIVDSDQDAVNKELSLPPSAASYASALVSSALDGCIRF